MSFIKFRAISPAFGAIVDGFHVDEVHASDKPVLNDAQLQEVAALLSRAGAIPG